MPLKNGADGADPVTYDAENRLVKIHETGTNPEVVTGEYFYDGDGNRIKTIVAGKTTYYIGNYYEKIVEGTSTTIKKYYYSGGMRVAMSEKINEGLENTRYFVTDHLGSTTKLINTNGTEYSETDYLAWGIDDPTPADIGTSFKYTGQRQAEAGLYFYNARWYDPKIGRFIQADTIIPEPGNPLAWDRYAYANNNPVKFTDPSGHKVDCGDNNAEECNSVQNPIVYYKKLLKDFGVSLSGPYVLSDVIAVYQGVSDIANAFAKYSSIQAAPSFLFKLVFGNSFYFEFGGGRCIESCWARSLSANSVRIYNIASGQLDPRLVVHEIGHSFNTRVIDSLGESFDPSDKLAAKWDTDNTFPHRSDGFAGPAYGWQQSTDGSPREEYADMFLGWTYDTWADDPFGYMRSQWMDNRMNNLLMNFL